jgi:hypothetical protein
MMSPRFADSIRASSPSGLAGHTTASDFYAAREIISCQVGAIPLDPAVPDRSPREAWHSSCSTPRGAGSGSCTATDAIDPVPVDFLRAQIKAKLFAHHACEEAAHRVLLPMGHAHDGGNRRPLRSAEHGEHASLFRPWPVFARGASFGLHLAPLMPRANRRLRCNGSPLARGDDFDCRCFDFGPVGSRANACLRRTAHCIILDPDRFEALLGDNARLDGYTRVRQIPQRAQEGRDAFCAPEDAPRFGAYAVAGPFRCTRRIPPRRRLDDL